MQFLPRLTWLEPIEGKISSRPWRLLGWVLFFAWLLRLLVALSSDTIFRLDEIWEYLEQSHRLVFGYGIVPWEYQYGVRNWLHAIPAAIVLQICESLGFGHPNYYVPAVRVFNATFSMVIPAGIYFFLRQRHELAARIALIICCFWWELIAFSPHTLPSGHSTYLMLIGLWLFRNNATSKILALSAFCFALAILLRPTYAVLIAIIGLVLLLHLPIKRWLAVVLGGLIGLVLYGFIDYVFWGTWWGSLVNHFDTMLFHSQTYAKEDDSFYDFQLIKKMIVCGFGLSLALFIFAIRQFRQYAVFIILIVLFFFLHPHPNAHYSYVYILQPIFAVLAGLIIAQYVPSKRYRIILGVAGIISILGLTAVLPGAKERFSGTGHGLFYQLPTVKMMKYLSNIPSEKVKAVYWKGFNPWSTGTYYYFHLPVPLYYDQAGFYYRHKKILYDGGYELNQVVSHIVTIDTDRHDGFEILERFSADGFISEDFVILENISNHEIIIPEPYLLDKPSRIDDYLEEHLLHEKRPAHYLPMDKK